MAGAAVTGDPYDVAHEAALVGTARARTAELEQAADALLGPSEAGVPSRLLDLAAAVTRVKRATASPARSDVTPQPPAPVQVREIGRASRTALEVVLTDAALQEEALRWVGELGLALDVEATVRVLELSTARPVLREAATAALGVRGRWLAAHNAAWSWAAGAPDAAEPEQRWEHATSDERLALLRDVRLREPGRGLALLQSTASGERADALAALVGALEVGLSGADEPFLEQLLDDRRVQVRRAAAALLVRLDGSALVRRGVVRVSRYVGVTGRLRKSLEVRPPEAADAEMVRDAVPTEVIARLGRSASLLAHELARVPPAALRAVVGLEADRLVALARAGDWWPSFAHGLVESALRWADVDVLVALVPHVPFPQLVHGLQDDAALAAVVTAHLRRSDPSPASSRALECLLHVPGPWGPRTAGAMWPALLEALAAAERGRFPYGVGEAARTAGRSFPVDAPTPPLDASRYSDDTARRAADTVLTTFTVRQSLRTALLHDVQENP